MVHSTFSSFMTARSGIVASQLALSITGQNMTNASTPGYTRQRVDLVSVGSSPYNSKVAVYGIGMGGGVSAASVTQLRDPYLDNRFRREYAGLGEIDAQYSVLNQLESIFDEWSISGMTDAFSNLFKAFEGIGGIDGGSDDMDVIARTQAELLVNLLHTYGKQLSNLRDDEVAQLEEVAIPRINEIFYELSELNRSIQKVQAVGAEDLELLDARNLLLDELSQYMDIKVTYTPCSYNKNMQDMSIELKVANGTNIQLMFNDSYEELSVQQNGNKTEIHLNGPLNGALGDISANLDTGSLRGILDMLNCAGELDSPASSVRGLPYYEKMMNCLVDTFAKKMNEINNSNIDPADPIQNYDLFETDDPSGNFTMDNIRVADGWLDGTYGVRTDNKIPYTLANAFDDKATEFEIGGQTIYKGSLDDFFGYFSSVLSSEVKAVKTLAENRMAVVNSADSMRMSVSSVSMDEETVNMILYQKSYNAASRFLTTLDEAMDQLINKTGIVGR